MMKKLVFLTAAAALFTGCGPQDEEQIAPEQVAEQSSALTTSDPVIGNWAWAQDRNFKLHVNTSGYGVMVDYGCFSGAVAWRNIVYRSISADGSTKNYGGQVGSATNVKNCYYDSWSDATFRANTNWQNLTVVYNSSYSEAYVRW
ncbi:MAG TPA: hypothetical protein VEU33_05800 [Archangium sp.]|nr:hypothetical protein [Archangium sp.]